ncbi:MAG TPA: condensation domain-containing protein, partial [Thermoanaerobaculia bacterium]|nr:condensation domain-containing protein [Thermoanaerobaculia bacterium]
AAPPPPPPPPPFRLDRAPLVRFLLVRLAPAEHAFLLTLHHAVADAWSLGVLVRDLAELYAADVEGRAPVLPVLPVQYGDVSRWQRRRLRGAALDELIGYWRRRLAGAPPVVALPTDRPRPQEPVHRGAMRPLVIPGELATALRTLAHGEGVTLFMLLLAAFDALLHSYSGAEDVVVGSNVAGRTRSELEEMVGFFVNMLVLRVDLSGDPTFQALLRRVRDVTLGAYAHQELPFDKLVDELRVERDPRVHPLFQAVFTLQNTPLPDLRLPGLELRPQEAEVATTHFDLIFNLMDGGEAAAGGEGTAGAEAGAVRGVVQYDRELFDAATIDAMVQRFETVLRVVAVRPEARLSEVVERAAAAGVREWAEREKDFDRVVDTTFRTVRRKAVSVSRGGA